VCVTSSGQGGRKKGGGEKGREAVLLGDSIGHHLIPMHHK